MILYIITHKSNIINIINIRFKNNSKINNNSAKQISKLIYKRHQKNFSITINYLLE